eukprot:gene27682-30659_t
MSLSGGIRQIRMGRAAGSNDGNHMMRLTMLTTFAAAAVLAGSSVAVASDCDSASSNNPAFSSSVTPARPCPPTEEFVKSKPDKAKLAAKKTKPAPTTDEATVTKLDDGGYRIVGGDTTVCVHGSVTFTMAAGKTPRGAALRAQTGLIRSGLLLHSAKQINNGSRASAARAIAALCGVCTGSGEPI